MRKGTPAVCANISRLIEKSWQSDAAAEGEILSDFDVDLSDPTYQILNLFYPRLSSRGVILVDDCVDGNEDWRAVIGYRKFCVEHKLEESYRYSFGIITKPVRDQARGRLGGKSRASCLGCPAD